MPSSSSCCAISALSSSEKSTPGSARRRAAWCRRDRGARGSSRTSHITRRRGAHARARGQRLDVETRRASSSHEAASERLHRATSQVVTSSPVFGSLASFNSMPMAASSSRMRSASLKSFALRAALRAPIKRDQRRPSPADATLDSSAAQRARSRRSLLVTREAEERRAPRASSPQCTGAVQLCAARRSPSAC